MDQKLCTCLQRAAKGDHENYATKLLPLDSKTILLPYDINVKKTLCHTKFQKFRICEVYLQAEDSCVK